MSNTGYRIDVMRATNPRYSGESISVFKTWNPESCHTNLYYKYSSGAHYYVSKIPSNDELWINWGSTMLEQTDNYGHLANIIIDYDNVIKLLPDSAFKDCCCSYYLQSVSFGAVSYIGDYAFAAQHNLSSVYMPTLEHIGKYAFGNCHSLTSVDFPLVSFVGDYAFTKCNNLQYASLPNTLVVGVNAFSECSKLISVNINNASIIRGGAFSFFYSSSIHKQTVLETVEMENVENIAVYGFYNCHSLQSVNAPKLINIGDSAFKYCFVLSEINAPLLTSIGSSAFEWCKSLKSAYFPNASFVGTAAFNHCNVLSEVNLDNIQSFGGTVFGSFCGIKYLYMRSISKLPTITAPPFRNSGIDNIISIYVPSSLVPQFQKTTSWLAVSSKFVGV